MSLILPMTQIKARTGPDPAPRTDAPDPASGAPFVRELYQALGMAVGPQSGPAGDLPVGAVTEQLDPLGAALRALLGAESATAVVQPGELAVEGAESVEPEPAQSAEAPVAAELAAELVLLSLLPPGTAPQSEIVEAPAEPIPTPAVPALVEAAQLSALAPATDLSQQGASTTLPSQTPLVTEALAGSLPESVPAPESDPLADRPSVEGPKVTPAKGQTFADLVQLITESQARDTARHGSKSAPQEPVVVPEPSTESTVLVQSAPAPEGEPEMVSPVGHRSDGPKPAFGELLPTQATESRPVRSTEIPAPALLNQVTRSIRLLAEGARSELHVKLHPAELGEVLVRLTLQDGVLNAQLQTTDAAVKATLDANLDALRARFEQHGLQVNSLAVSTGAGQLTDDGQAKSGWAQSSNESSRPSSGDDGEGEEPEGATQPTPVRRILGRRGLSRLDHLA